MDSVTGWCLRLISLFIWVLLAVAASVAAPLLLFGMGNENKQLGSVFVLASTPYVCTIVPICLEWLMCQQTFEWGSLDWMVAKKWVRLPFWRFIVRLKSWKKLILQSLHFVTASLCGAVCITVAGNLRPSGSSFPFWLMLSYGAVHAAVYNVRGGDRVVYPAIHLTRLRRMLDSLYPALLDASFVWTRATLLSTALYFITPTSIASLTGTVSTLMASMLYIFSLSVSGKLVHILLSERLHRKDVNDLDHTLVLELLIVRLKELPDQLNTALTMQELSIRSTFYNLACWKATFHDHLGTDLWFPLATTCLRELEGLIASMDTYLEAQQQTRNEVQRIQWNASSLPKLLSANRQKALPQRVVFEEQLVARHMLCIWAARLLTDVAVLSREHDTCTLLQMPPDGVPGLADVLQTLLTAYALLDKHLEDTVRQSQQQRQHSWLWKLLHVPGRAGSGPSAAEDSAWAVHGCLEKCISHLSFTFGPGLAKLRTRAMKKEVKTIEHVGQYCDAFLGAAC